MEFRRTPLAVGRKINLNTEIIPNGSEQLLKTFFVNGKFRPLSELHVYIDKEFDSSSLVYCFGRDLH